MKKIFFAILMTLLLAISIIFLCVSQFVNITLGFRIFIIVYQIVFYLLIIAICFIQLLQKSKNKKSKKDRHNEPME